MKRLLPGETTLAGVCQLCSAEIVFFVEGDTSRQRQASMS